MSGEEETTKLSSLITLLKRWSTKMPVGEIIYSDRYEDEEFEYRHVNFIVILRPNINEGNNF